MILRKKTSFAKSWQKVSFRWVYTWAKETFNDLRTYYANCFS